VNRIPAGWYTGGVLRTAPWGLGVKNLLMIADILKSRRFIQTVSDTLVPTDPFLFRTLGWTSLASVVKAKR